MELLKKTIRDIAVRDKEEIIKRVQGVEDRKHILSCIDTFTMTCARKAFEKMERETPDYLQTFASLLPDGGFPPGVKPSAKILMQSDIVENFLWKSMRYEVLGFLNNIRKIDRKQLYRIK